MSNGMAPHERKKMKRFICLLLLTAALLGCVACNTNPSDGAPKYVFNVGSITVKINDEAEAVIGALGEALDYSESPSCAFEGLDKVYIYAGFRIQTYPLNGKDYVYSVELTDDSVKTPEGIAIGSSADAVLKAYGEAGKQTDTSILYSDDVGGVTLQFILRDGQVKNIQYLRNED